MPEANKQSTPVEQSRVESVYVERLFNLGNYENIKYGVRVVIVQNDNPGRVLTSLENILNDLRADHGVSDWFLERARRTLAKPEAELTNSERESLDEYRAALLKVLEASERRQKAREALATLNYTKEHKDHKENWDDEDGTCHPDDCGRPDGIEF
jgi:hypothetical protein